MTFGNSSRLSPDQARTLIDDLVRGMRNRVKYLYWQDDRDRGLEFDEGADSLAKQQYGPPWLLIYGVYNGMSKMRIGSEMKMDPVTFESDGWDVDDREWRKHYDQYGHGVYGDGLEIGKRLCFYQDSNFEFTEGEAASSDSKFTFTDG